PQALVVLDGFSLLGIREQSPCKGANNIARFIKSAADSHLQICANRRHWHFISKYLGEQGVVWAFLQARHHLVNRGINFVIRTLTLFPHFWVISVVTGAIN